MEKSVLLADDHIMISKGLRRSIEHYFGLTSISSVTSCSGVLQELKKRRYTHLILDIGLSDGSALEILPVIIKLFPGVNIMIYSAKPAAAYAKHMNSFGIKHYLSKQDDEEVTRSIIGHFLQNEALSKEMQANTYNPFAFLSKREFEVLHHLLEGKGTKEISETLNVSAATVSVFKRSIFEKTETDNLKALYELASIYGVRE
jgi:DNA-binding NarL/FixJ family response regulator